MLEPGLPGLGFLRKRTGIPAFGVLVSYVVFPGEMNFPDIASRWQLFSSAAEQAGGEFHVVVPRWVEGVGAGRDAIAKAADAIGIRIAHVWEI